MKQTPMYQLYATTLVVAGDPDIFPPAHAVELFGLATVTPFLDEAR